jgi:uncharacterized short protein YbdD (DUF466 family)
MRLKRTGNRPRVIEQRAPAIVIGAGVWLRSVARSVWLGVREWCGDSAYERYLQAQRAMPGGSALLTPSEFYVDQLNRRYSRPSRCC